MNGTCNWIKRLGAFVMSVILTMSVIQTVASEQQTNQVMAETTAQITVGCTNVNVRQSPTTSSPSITKLNGGHALVILDQPNGEWYHVSFTKDGSSYTGYVYADYVTVLSAPPAAPGGSGSDADFEAYLTAQGFPESYKPYLRDLHTKHPQWKFVALQTGLDWNTVIENERNKSGQIKNLINGTSSAPRYNWRATEVGYSWANDTWSPYDGTTWFAASKDIVSYYMDPRTYLYETYIFAFEQLSYDSSIHNAAGVEAILANTFMANANPVGENRTFSAEIMEAAAKNNVSPYHLASRMRQEMGATAGVNATGASKTYPNIFNFFNIGAVDSAGGGAVEKGLAWAAASGNYGRPWNSAYKAIMGGSEYIGASYINRGQDTLYTQKFNVVYRGNLYGHQYMTNVQAPATEAAAMCRAYQANGLINSALVFKIPVYVNMPAEAVSKPADSGSPNNWLKSLTVSGYALTPTFSGSNTAYSMIVDHTVSSITVTAATVNRNANISGTGTINLAVGMNQVPITVTAQNGTQRTYTITVVRKDANGGTGTAVTNPNAPPINTGYHVSGNTISGISVGTDVSTFVTALGATGSQVTIYKSDGVTVNSGTVGTGNIVSVTNGSANATYTIIIYGDVSGDGSIGIGDLVNMKKNLLNQMNLNGVYFSAADVDKDGKITIKDLVTTKKHILGQQSITQ